MKVEVLGGQGYVRLVDSMGNDDSIVRAARVSYDGDAKTGSDPEADAKLIRYLMKNRHTSPFESVNFTFEIKCPLFIARQWHRHRSWSYNELSARYAKLDEGFYTPRPHNIGVQSKDNKQMREILAEGEAYPESVLISSIIDQSCERSFEVYEDLIAKGCPRELARSVLPTAAFTRFYGTVDLHNLFHFIRLRVHPHAQHEIQEYGHALLELVRPITPIATAAFEETL